MKRCHSPSLLTHSSATRNVLWDPPSNIGSPSFCSLPDDQPDDLGQGEDGDDGRKDADCRKKADTGSGQA